jgi:hypothetical protein
LSDSKPILKPEEQEAPVPKSIAEEIDLFVNQIDCLAETLPLAAMAITAAHDSSQRDFVEFIDERSARVHDETNKTTTYSFEDGQYPRLLRLLRRVQKTQLAQQLVPRSLLVSLVSQFDAYLGRLIRQLFNIKPEILDSSANTLTFAQLTEFGSIESAREFLIDKEVESVLRKNHSEQFDWLENKFGLPLRNNLEAWPMFVEVTERRNLFVHTNGVVSHQYMEVCRRHSCPIAPELCPGKSLSVTREYFAAAYECLFEIGVKLAQVMWRKLQPDKILNADASLSRVTYELLAEGRYRLARSLLDFATITLKKHGSEESRLIMVVNRAQAYKWSGDDEGAKKIVNAEDWSAKGLKFKLAQSVLLDDLKVAIEIMRQIAASGEINKHFYREWPLFKEIRKSKEFAAMFEQIFGEPLNAITLDTKEEPEAAPGTVN